jgi:anti-sigma factor RsiW
LHQYFDGELHGRQLEQVRSHVDGCESCSGELASLKSLHKAIALTAEDAANSVHSEALFARIERGLQEAEEPSLLERMRVWWEELLAPGTPAWMPATAAIGVAAAIFMVARWAGDSVKVPQVATPSIQEAAPSKDVPKVAKPVPAPVMRSEIIEVDFGTNAGTVFEVALAEGLSTPVIWINDEEEEEQ